MIVFVKLPIKIKKIAEAAGIMTLRHWQPQSSDLNSNVKNCQRTVFGWSERKQNMSVDTIPQRPAVVTGAISRQTTTQLKVDKTAGTSSSGMKAYLGGKRVCKGLSADHSCRC